LAEQTARTCETADMLAATARVLTQRRAELATDYPVVVTLKQGFVEVQHPLDADPDFRSSVLLPRSAIDTLNTSIRALGVAKVNKRKFSCCWGFCFCIVFNQFFWSVGRLFEAKDGTEPRCARARMGAQTPRHV
jgi:hypothetical protein